MKELKIGTQVFSYCYGSMTVEKIEGNFVYFSVDDINGLSTSFVSKCKTQETDFSNVKFFTTAYGHWFFDNKEDVLQKKEDCNFLIYEAITEPTKDKKLYYATGTIEPVRRNLGTDSHTVGPTKCPENTSTDTDKTSDASEDQSIKENTKKQANATPIPKKYAYDLYTFNRNSAFLHSMYKDNYHSVVDITIKQPDHEPTKKENVEPTKKTETEIAKKH